MAVISDFFDAAGWVIDDPAQFLFDGTSVTNTATTDETGTAVKEIPLNREDFGERFSFSRFGIKTSVQLPDYIANYLIDEYPPYYYRGAALKFKLVSDNGTEFYIDPLSADTYNRDENYFSAKLAIVQPGSDPVEFNYQYQIAMVDGSLTLLDGEIDWIFNIKQQNIEIQVGQFNPNIPPSGEVVYQSFSAALAQPVVFPDHVSIFRESNTQETGMFDGSIITYDTTANTEITTLDVVVENFAFIAGNFPWRVGMVVREICKRAGIKDSRINALEIDPDYVLGCYATADDDAFVLIEELARLYFFDPSNYDGKLNFLKRGRDIVAEIPYGDLVVENGDIDQRKRQDSIEVPRVANLEFYEIDGWLTPDKESSDRSLDIRSLDEETEETGVIMTYEQAAKTVVITHKVKIEEQNGGYDFSLPDSYIGLAVGDIVVLEGSRLRIEEIEIDDGFQSYKTVIDRKSAYTSDAIGSAPIEPGTPPDTNRGDTVFHVIDSHILSDQDDRLCYYVAANGYGRWSGAVIEVSLDGGNTYDGRGTVSVPTTMGSITTALPIHPVWYPDDVNTVRVRLLRDDMSLDSTTLTGMLNRSNLAIIGNELINFGSAVEIEPGLWELSNLLRGRKGSGITRHEIGERFVILRRQTLAKVPVESFLLNKPLTFRATSVEGDAPSAASTIFYFGRSQRQRAPAYLSAVRSGGNIEISWQGIGKIGSSANVSYGVHFRGFTVRINGDIVETTLNESITVSDPGGSVTIGVAAKNEFTGDGPLSEITI